MRSLLLSSFAVGSHVADSVEFLHMVDTQCRIKNSRYHRNLSITGGLAWVSAASHRLPVAPAAAKKPADFAAAGVAAPVRVC
jgi:hypothetical protein